MKHLTQLFGMVLLVTLAAGCTHNNGDIGSWFGTWNVERIEIDGVAQADYQGQYFFQFSLSLLRSFFRYPEIKKKMVMMHA